MDKNKETKRKEAEARQAEYDKLTTQQKIDRARKRPGNSKREIEKLTKKLEKQV